jgi:hypothetical protein
MIHHITKAPDHSVTVAHMQPDLHVERAGMSLFLFHPLTDAASQWLKDHTDPANRTFHGESLAVESRYAYEFAQAALDDGLDVV